MNIHLIGIGGVGMAGLAVLLKARGHEVSGCDVHASPRTRWLEGQGIPVSIGHSPSHLADVDEVVITPAVRTDEPERVVAGAKGIRVRFRGEVLAELANACETIAVCGSHGKTTTATWIAKLLLALGEDVSWCIGGETGDFPVARPSKLPKLPKPSKLPKLPKPSKLPKPLLVVEADESDGTLALYRAKTLVVNRCDYDHPDHFKTEADYFACYETAKRNAAEVIESEGLGGLEGLEGLEGLGGLGGLGSLGSLEGLGGLGGLEGLEGLEGLAEHNRKNARAAVEVALRRGHSLAAILKALPSIVSVLPDRRFQVIWPPSLNSQLSTLNSQPSFLVITDYAHHPTEMACAVGMARERCRGRLRVLFQPHRYSRTKALLKDFPAAFAGADEVILCPTYAAFERPVEGGDITDLHRACHEAFGGNGPALVLAGSCEEAWERARDAMRDGDLTLLLGAGDIINLVPRVVSDLSALA